MKSARMPAHLSAIAPATLAVVLSAALLGGCTFGRAPAPTPIPVLFTTPGAIPGTGSSAGPGAGPGIRPGMARQVYTVQRGEIVDTMTFGAQVVRARQEDLFFGAAGRVQAVYVHSGAQVQLDQVIAVLDTRVLELDRQAAAARLDLAQARLDLAEANLRFARLQRAADLQAARLELKRIEARAGHATELYRLDHTLQELAVKQAELALEQLGAGVEPGLEADVTQAAIALKKVETALADAEITAPFAGQVLLYDALQKGKVIQAYSPVAALVDPAALLLEANLLPADLAALTEGMAVQIKLSDPLAKPIPGVVRTLPQPFGSGGGTSVLIVPKDGTAAGHFARGQVCRSACCATNGPTPCGSHPPQFRVTRTTTMCAGEMGASSRSRSGYSPPIG